MLVQSDRRRTLAFIIGGLVLLSTSVLYFALSPHYSLLELPPYWPSRLSAGQAGPITYIPYTFGWPMLLQTLKGYQRAGWRDIVIVDNSWSGSAVKARNDLRAKYGVRDVIAPPVRLRFSQLQAFLDHLLRIDGGRYYFWSHTDVLLVPFSKEGTYELARQQVEAADAEGRLGVMFFNYDLLSAVTTSAGDAAPWDPAMPQYGADCDRYRRLRLAGLDAIDKRIPLGEVVHLHSMLSDEEFDELYDGEGTVKQRAERVREMDAGREKYAWRHAAGALDVEDEMDRKAAQAEGEGGRVYHYAKWGEDPTCELADRTPAFDLPHQYHHDLL